MTLTGILHSGVTSIDSSCESLSILFFYEFRNLISLRYLYDGENVQITCESVISKLVRYLAYSVTTGTSIKRELLKTRTCSHGPSLKNGVRKKEDMHTGCRNNRLGRCTSVKGVWFFGKSSPN